ncbi:MAG TPA: cytochrome c3 family protein, partial [Steroidobacteraceae bacterium]|nr:cytochrome c3 family protein [Steroidobacteraceae bacterium]
HIPTNAPCAQCHTTAGNYALYVMGATGHAGITNNCAQCHAYGLSFYNMAPPTLVEPPSGATGHIPAVPPNGTAAIACELCHAPTVFTTFSGTVMKHAYVTSMKCDSCHEYGMTWKTNVGTQLWTRPSPNHHAGQDCGGSGCHTSRDVKHVGSMTRQGATTVAARTAGTTAPKRGMGPVARAPAGSAPLAATAAASAAATMPVSAAAAVAFSHVSVAGTACVSCHSAANGSGKPASHVASSNACQNCHTTIAWLPVTRVDHTQVLGSCASCHNGTIATGKPSSHLPTSAACESCHTTTAWTPARFDHAAVTPHTCTTCHNTVRAIGMPRTHIPTTQSCDTCHGTLAWSPVKVDHSHLTTSCVSCHNNVAAVGFSPGHLRTQVDCARCHRYPDWSAVSFRHASSAYPTGRHAKLACSSCHTTNTDQVPYASAAEAGTCAGCHAKDFKPAAHPKTAKGVSYNAHELADCTGACHVYSDTTQSTITRSLPGPHHRVTDATIKR